MNKCIDKARFTKLVWRFHTGVYFEEGTRNSQNVQIGLANREFHQSEMVVNRQHLIIPGKGGGRSLIKNSGSDYRLVLIHNYCT